jgi:glycosyltransferase involved in cell wall biosynthesis
VSPSGVSVVIPTSGRFDLLGRAIESLLQSTLVPREVIVVADSSLKDPSIHLEMLMSKFGGSFEKLSCIQSSRASGAAGTRNAGLSLVSSEFVAFLDDDDEFLPEKLSQQISVMQETGTAFSFSDYYRVSDSSSTYANCQPKSKYKGSLAREIAFDDCRIATPTVVIRMSFLKSKDVLFPEDMHLREDNYSWLKLAATPGFTFNHIPNALTYVYVSNFSIQRPSKSKLKRGWSLFTAEELRIYELARNMGVEAPPCFKIRRLILRIMVSVFQFFISKS